MTALLIYPAFHDRASFYDQLFRAVWHFLPMAGKIDQLVFLYSGEDYQEIDVNEILSNGEKYLPADFDPAIAHFSAQYINRVRVLNQDTYPQNIDGLKGIIVWETSNPSSVYQAQILAKLSEAQVVLADPNRNQQETLETIRFAYSLWEQEELGTLVEHSFEQFQQNVGKWRGKKISAFGNGPSLQKVVRDRLVIGKTTRAVCNSTIGDQEALDFLKPELMFCGDPVQHCGVSLFAGRFRQDLAKALLSEDRVLFTQLGYVPYFRATTHQDCHDRIIGIGNDRRPTFNLDLTTEYLTAATANIFTMLVLPVAFTLSTSVDIFGCDGMSFSAATKPWSHSGEEDYMSKMSVTHRVHKGFWIRNYEEEYWAYSRDLVEILTAAEEKGCTVRVRTPSYVPALAKRFVPLI